jgi:hypothetical protein
LWPRFTLITSIPTPNETGHMTHSFRRLISFLLTLTTSVAFSSLGVVASANAGQLASGTITLSNPVQGLASDYTFQFNVPSTGGGNVGTMSFRFTDAASGSTTPPPFFNSTGSGVGLATVGVQIGATDDTSNWALTKSTNGLLTLNATTPTAAPAGTTITVKVTAINNNGTSPDTSGGNTTMCDSITNSETCWVKVQTYSDVAGATPVDTTTLTYTVIDSIVTTAQVDPILTFTVAGVSSGAILTNDSNADTHSGTQVTTTPTSIPFGNVSLGTAKLAQHKLTVVTNANNGYTVYQKFSGSNLLTGSFSGNHIDSFGTGCASPVPYAWTSSHTWAAPTCTTSNAQSGYVGVRTNDSRTTAGSNINASNVYAGPIVGGNTSGNPVMTNPGPDDGGAGAGVTATSGPRYVTYEIGVDAYQPADLYTGAAVYNVIASY